MTGDPIREFTGAVLTMQIVASEARHRLWASLRGIYVRAWREGWEAGRAHALQVGAEKAKAGLAPEPPPMAIERLLADAPAPAPPPAPRRRVRPRDPEIQALIERMDGASEDEQMRLAAEAQAIARRKAGLAPELPRTGSDDQ